MKKLILFYSLLLIGFGVNAEKVSRYMRTVSIPKGQSFVSIGTNVTDDRVSTDSTKYIIINCSQDYPQQQDVVVNMTAISGSPSVAVTLQGKKFDSDSWTEVISVQTWTSTAIHLTSTLPTRYRTYAIKFVCSTAPAWPSTCQFKSWFVSPDVTVNSLTDGTATFTAGALTGATTIAASGRITGTGGATITGATTNINASSNFATNIGTGSTDAAVTVGGGFNTVAINSSDWDIGTTGIMTGIGAITADGLITGTAGATISGAATNINVSSNFATNIGTGTTTETVTIGNAANAVALVAPTTVTGALTATGGMAFASGSTVFWAKGGAPLAVATGTDAAATAGDRYWVELEIPHNATITGLSYLVGSVGGTDSVMVHLYNSAGTQVATSKKTGAAHGDIVGTAAEIQSVAFTTTYAAVAGKYFAAIQFNGTTAKFRSYLVPGSKFVASSAAGTYDTAVASITPGTTWTVSKGPILATY